MLSALTDRSDLGSVCFISLDVCFLRALLPHSIVRSVLPLPFVSSILSTSSGWMSTVLEEGRSRQTRQVPFLYQHLAWSLLARSTSSDAGHHLRSSSSPGFGHQSKSILGLYFQLVEYLPSRHTTLGLMSSTIQARHVDQEFKVPLATYQVPGQPYIKKNPSQGTMNLSCSSYPLSLSFPSTTSSHGSNMSILTALFKSS